MAGILLPSSLLSSEEGEEEEVTSQLLELDQVCTTSLRSNLMMDSAVYSTQGFLDQSVPGEGINVDKLLIFEFLKTNHYIHQKFS